MSQFSDLFKKKKKSVARMVVKALSALEVCDFKKWHSSASLDSQL